MKQRTITTAEMRDNLEEVIEGVRSCREEVVIETDGEPAAVIVSARAWRAREARRREEMDRLFEIIDRIQAQNADVDPEQVERDVAEALRQVRAGE